MHLSKNDLRTTHKDSPSVRYSIFSFTLLATLAVFMSAVGVARDGSNIDSSIVNAIQPWIDQKVIAGAVTLVADPKEIIHVAATGQADIEKNLPMEADTIFWIASMTKPVTGACVMMMVDEGKISLDDPVGKYLPELNSLATEDGKQYVVTIRQLMNHSSGMKELPRAAAYSVTTLKEAVTLFSQLPLDFVPGSKWQYSQTSINTAARVVEVVSGLTFDQFVQERICKPLKMSDTNFYLSEEQMKRLATSYKRTSEGSLEATTVSLLLGKAPTDRNRVPAANGGLFSTATDYVRFCQMLLNEGTLDGKRILKPESVKTMATINTGELVTGFTPGNGWGVGCCIIKEPQGVSQSLSPGSFGHGGAYGTQAWIDPIRKRIYLLMVQRTDFPNSDDSPVRNAFQEAAAKSLALK